MLSNCLLQLVRFTIHKNLALFFTACFLQLLLSDASPVSKAGASSNAGCPEGWLHNKHFCVARAKGASEKAVAFYCAGYGGIGITGLCIIRAPYYNAQSDVSLALAAQHVTDPLNGSPLTAFGQTNDLGPVGNRDDLGKTSSLAGEAGLLDEDKAIEEIGCPRGWIHHQKICVYKPMPLRERCQHMDAVEFNGLCLKLADTNEIARRGLEHHSGTDKRVCCCSHINAKSNGYAC